MASRTPVPVRWDATQLPSVHGQVVIVTGGGTGIGFHTALELARRGAQVIIACHIEAQGRDAVTAITSEISNSAEDKSGRAEFMLLDVSSLASVKAFADEFQKTHERLDVLVLNAGILAREYVQTPDEYECAFATNYLGHFALTAHLMETLKRSEAARIVTVSSVLHARGKFHAGELMMLKETFRRMKAYCQTKIYVLLFTFELHRRLQASGTTNVIAVASHPGIVATNMMATDLSDLGFATQLKFWIAGKLMHGPEFGALPLLYAAAAPGVQGGEFYGPDGFLGIYGHPQHARASQDATSEANARILWTKSEELAKVKFNLE
ncbi:hypothetical protein Poli38472_003747 [Pythium oligandrum]|uniref:NAD(P)-binding protein n=1 Tax=Pythium oligandrum TaxID=41045 RepID=A0A8K1CP30_PYTOL|nr:hypothetical protein Poli38472_003747 [Pythium oligandrum]|eukprot:TMW65982.1 hypothetical protein Poli38472_003747 [Pythium oligandrum]